MASVDPRPPRRHDDHYPLPRRAQEGRHRATTSWKAPGAARRDSHQERLEEEDALARRLSIEEPVRLRRLLQPIVMGKELLEGDAPVCHEARALGLPDRA